MSKLDLRDVRVVYNSRTGLHNDLRDFLKQNFAHGFDLFTNYWDKWSSQLCEQSWDEEAQAHTSEKLPSKITIPNDKFALIPYRLTEREKYRLRSNRGLGYRMALMGAYKINPGEANEDEPDFIDAVYPLAIRHVKTIETTNEETGETNSFNIYSEFGESTLKYFNSAIDLTNMSLPITSNAMDIIRTRQSAYARANRFSSWNEYPCPKTDNIGSFSCGFEGKLTKEAFINAAGNAPIKVIKINSFYRGGNGNASIEMTSAKAARIAKGNYIFPYLTKWPVLNQETMETEYKIFFCLGIFDELDKVMKYKRSRAFIPDLIRDIEKYGGLKLFNPEAYEKLMKQKFGKHTKHWDGITNLFRDLPENAVVKYETKIRKVTPQNFSYIESAATLKKSDESMRYDQVHKAYTEIDEKVKALNTSKNNIEYDLRYYKDDFERLSKKLAELTAKKEKNAKELERINNNLQGYEEAHSKLQTESLTEKENYEKYLSKIINNETDNKHVDQAKNWIENLQNTGVVINEIWYWDSDERNEVALSTKPEIGLWSIHNYEPNKPQEKKSRYVLNRIEFSTTKPMIIRVDQGRDGENCKKVVGGPWNVEITATSLSLGLASTTSCFGIDPRPRGESVSNGWIHPHAASFTIYSTNWEEFSNSILNRTANGCLGEAAPTLRSAFLTNNPKMAIFAAMTWLGSANSADQWGKHWKHFPNLSDVNIEGIEVEDTDGDTLTTAEPNIRTEDGMDQIAEMIESLIENIETAPTEIVEEEATVEEGYGYEAAPAPLPSPSTPPNQQRYVAGVANYVPYSSRNNSQPNPEQEIENTINTLIRDTFVETNSNTEEDNTASSIVNEDVETSNNIEPLGMPYMDYLQAYTSLYGLQI